MSDRVVIVAEQREGKLNRATWEAVVAAQALGKDTDKDAAVLLLGDNVSDLADEIAAKGLHVYLVQDGKLANYTPDGYSAAIEQFVEKNKPSYLLFSHTYAVRDYVAKLAASLGKPLINDCVRFRVDSGQPVFVRQVYQGKIDADFVFEGDGPFLVTFQVGAFNGDDVETGGSGEIEKVDVDLGSVEIRTKVLEIFEGVKQEVDLSKAERIVSVGRGIKKPENLDLMKELVSALGAELAASRPVCDEGWLPLDRQIGSSGQTVAPKLYLAVGISGAIQHIVGMKNAGTIVAINKDPNAPIFDIADYGVVGDLFEIVPELISAVKELK